MDKRQLEALQNYVAAVVRLMTRHAATGHDTNVMLMLDAKRKLEAAFGQSLDKPTPFPDLL